MSTLRALWSPGTWWPSLLGAGAGLFLLREVWALASGRPQDSLSAFVWRQLAVTQNESIAQWSATDYFVFCAWVTLVLFLTYHFFFHRWT